MPISEEEGQETFLKSGKERFLPPFLRGCPLRKNLSKWKGGGGGEENFSTNTFSGLRTQKRDMAFCIRKIG